jgi:predicted NBD/HSP70 family sugar kinase
MKLTGANLENARSHNRRVIFEAIRRNARLSRADLTRLTKLTPQTVSNITTELLAEGFLRTLPTERLGRGQPAVPFEINPDGAYSIGIQVSSHEVQGVVVDLAGQIVARSELPFGRLSPEQAVKPLKELTDALLRTGTFDPKRVIGTGLAIPGPFGVDGLSAIGPTTLPGWEDLSVERFLSASLQMQITVSNDAAAAAIGERLYGAGKESNDFAYLYIGVGLGVGLFLNGQIYEGQAHNAGEIGHIVVEPEGRQCYCGNKGCMERYLSLWSAYEELQIADPSGARPEHLVQAMRNNPAAAERWLQTASDSLRRSLNILECLLDIETVIVGGLMPDELIKSLIERSAPLFASTGQKKGRTVPRLQAGRFGSDTAALGAAALPFFNSLNPNSNLLLKTSEMES